MTKKLPQRKAASNRWTKCYLTTLKALFHKEFTTYSQLINGLHTAISDTRRTEMPALHRNWLDDTHTGVSAAARIGWLHGIFGQQARFTPPVASRVSKVLTRYAYNEAYRIGQQTRLKHPNLAEAGSAGIQSYRT